MTNETWDQIMVAVDTIKPGVHRIEGSDSQFEWKVYVVTGDIKRIDIKEIKDGH